MDELVPFSMKNIDIDADGFEGRERISVKSIGLAVF